jgi:hypothetical protein
MLDLTKNQLAAGGLPLWNAVFCLDCEVISSSRSDKCPVCSGGSLVNLARILGGSLFAHREDQSQEGEHALFDVTITVDLRQMYAKDLTTTLERLTSVIGPKLVREQAMLHIDVKPSLDKIKSQGLLCFQEQNAA